MTQQHEAPAPSITSPGEWINFICEYLTLDDLMSFALTCKEVNCIKMSSETARKLVKIHPIASNVDTQFIDFYHPTLASFRVNLYHVIVGTPFSDTMQIDPNSRRLLSRSYSTVSAEDHEAGGSESDDDFPVMIEKHLESASFDEYDDFHPRHPEYRAHRGHRRGGSCFNSDLSDVVDALNKDECGSSGNIAKLAQMAMSSLTMEDS